MAKVRIVNEGITVEVPEGGRLLAYIREKSNMPFGCEKGECGTCICTVLRGIENIRPPAHEEWNYLKINGAYPNQRLACQIWVKKGELEIEY